MPAGDGADRRCVEFLQWALPRLGLRWAGFRKVRRQVCRRLRSRLEQLELTDLDAYRVHLDAHPEEWSVLDSLTPITITRFYRDAEVFAALEHEVLPVLAADATAHLRDRCFTSRGGRYDLRPQHRELVSLHHHDLRTPAPAEPFDLVLCRNVAFTYFAAAGQQTALARLTGARRTGGALAVGVHESLPEPHRGLAPWPDARSIFRRMSRTSPPRAHPSSSC
jgi:chemotaxis methyl-accepting protein methylase